VFEFGHRCSFLDTCPACTGLRNWAGRPACIRSPSQSNRQRGFLVSPVTGQADILVVPDLESGNMLAKQLEYLGGAQLAGIVLDARVPTILTSRADSAETRLVSCAVAVLLHYAAHPAVKV